MEGDLTWGGEHSVKYTDDVFRTVHPKHLILVSNVSPMHSIKTQRRHKVEIVSFETEIIIVTFLILTQGREPRIEKRPTDSNL